LSDTPRMLSYSGGARRRQRRPPFFRWVFLLATVAMIAWVAWVTRDAYPMAAVVPADNVYELYVVDFLDKRKVAAASPVWQLFPQEHDVRAWPETLASDHGAPEWVRNNLVAGPLYVGGRDVDGFSDPVGVAEMSRIGCLIERFRRFFLDTESDWAGGLALRRIPSFDLYYAVRGRVLVASPSRDAIVRALTVAPENTIPTARLDALRERARGASAAVRYAHAGAAAPEALPVRSLIASIRFEPGALTVNARAQWTTVFAEQLAPLTAATPRALPEPPDGPVAISADLGLPLPAALAHMWGVWDPDFDAAPVWRPMFRADGLPEALAPDRVFEGVLDNAGTAWRLVWHGIDRNAMAPLPVIGATVDAGNVNLAAQFDALPSPPPDIMPWDMVLRYDPETGRMSLPMPDGPALEPTATVRDGELVFSSSRIMADHMIAQPAAASGRDAPEGNVLLVVQPETAVRTIIDAGADLARGGYIRDHTEASFREAARAWLDPARGLTALRLFARNIDGAVALELRVGFAESTGNTDAAKLARVIP